MAPPAQPPAQPTNIILCDCCKTPITGPAGKVKNGNGLNDFYPYNFCTDCKTLAEKTISNFQKKRQKKIEKKNKAMADGKKFKGPIPHTEHPSNKHILVMLRWVLNGVPYQLQKNKIAMAEANPSLPSAAPMIKEEMKGAQDYVEVAETLRSKGAPSAAAEFDKMARDEVGHAKEISKMESEGVLPNPYSEKAEYHHHRIRKPGMFVQDTLRTVPVSHVADDPKVPRRYLKMPKVKAVAGKLKEKFKKAFGIPGERVARRAHATQTVLTPKKLGVMPTPKEKALENPLIYHTMYKKLIQIVPPELWHEGASGKSKSGGFMDLNYDYLFHDGKGHVIALSHYFEQEGDLIADPDMQIRIYPPPFEGVEALTFQDQWGYREVYPDPTHVDVKAKKDLNKFLNFWLTNLINQKHKIPVETESSTVGGEMAGQMKLEVNPDGDENPASLQRIKRIKSYSGLAQYMAEELTGDPVGEIPKQVSSPYASGPTNMVYQTNDGKHVIIVETSHKQYDIFEVPKETQLIPMDENPRRPRADLKDIPITFELLYDETGKSGTVHSKGTIMEGFLKTVERGYGKSNNQMVVTDDLSIQPKRVKLISGHAYEGFFGTEAQSMTSNPKGRWLKRGEQLSDYDSKRFKKITKKPGKPKRIGLTTSKDGNKVFVLDYANGTIYYEDKGVQMHHIRNPEGLKIGEESENPSNAWDVFLHGENIDTVFYTEGNDAEDIRKSLIEHDGYDPDIEVKRRKGKLFDNPTKSKAKHIAKGLGEKHVRRRVGETPSIRGGYTVFRDDIRGTKGMAKRKAQDYAENARAKGYLARVLPVAEGWAVYVSGQKRAKMPKQMKKKPKKMPVVIKKGKRRVEKEKAERARPSARPKKMKKAPRVREKKGRPKGELYTKDDFITLTGKDTDDSRIIYLFRSKDDNIEANVFFDVGIEHELRGLINSKPDKMIQVMTGHTVKEGDKPLSADQWLDSLVGRLEVMKIHKPKPKAEGREAPKEPEIPKEPEAPPTPPPKPPEEKKEEKKGPTDEELTAMLLKDL
jgi:hypothetical protein